MLKQIMTATVLGVSTLGIMSANATTDGVYVTGQAGYANTHMKNKIVPKLSYAGSGFEIPNNGLAGRLAVGYQFNQNLAVELGYLKLANKKGTFKLAPTSAYEAGTETLEQNAIDFSVKGILPITEKFNAYGKLGVAYLTNTITGDFDGKKDNDNEYFSIAKHKWAPEAAVGVSYDITPNLFVDASLTHIQPVGKNKPGNIDFAALGLGYSFG